MSRCFGTISWGLRTSTDESFKDLAWLAVDNKQFYLPSDYKVDNRLIHLDYITDVLGLEWNNFTNMDLAVDDSTNFSKKITSFSSLQFLAKFFLYFACEIICLIFVVIPC